ncbi:MAG: protein kinase [Polyangiaceae bacterium]|nr:protein kinase [Polyangiaceae bacterium]
MDEPIEVPARAPAPTPAAAPPAVRAPAPAPALQPKPAQARTFDPDASSQVLVFAENEDGTQREPDADPYIGMMFGERYLVDKVLGEGGMGRVYLAHHKIIDKRVAIKVLHAELAKDKEAVGRFMREARAASSIGNPHIVDILDFGELDDGSTYFVMEFLAGLSLGQLMESRGKLPVDLILDIAIQLCDGLAGAHAREIVHRDLKPDNITLVTHGAQKNFCKILDFGIAKVSSGTSATKLTMAGAVFGTPHYMSPEQAAGAAVDHRTDIYSLGVMMYEMVSGETPFNADNFMGILTQHMYKAPVPLRALVTCPDTPPGLEAVILKCLSKKPDGRYQTMEELAEDLQTLKAGGVPKAVHEMMARSGNFNVPADYFKSASRAVLPATPPERGSRRSPILWIALVVAGVALAAFFVLRQSLSGDEAAASASPAPTSAGSAPSAAPVREVMLAAEPSDGAFAVIDGTRHDLPAMVKVPEGGKVTVELARPGSIGQTLTLDGSEVRRVVKLQPDAQPTVTAAASATAAASSARPVLPLPLPVKTVRPPPPATTKTGDVVDPWGKKK